MGGRKGHWFKCPNGMNLISIVHFYQFMVFEHVLIITFKTRRYRFKIATVSNYTNQFQYLIINLGN